jgi:CelD/BcsL family acetyltransferase involved in cellulose biosynthesis
MISFIAGDYDQIGWETLAARSPEHNLMQSWAYGEAKAASGGWQVERGILTDGTEPVGIAQALVRPLPVVGSFIGGGLCWVNRGPLMFDIGRKTEALAAMHSHFVTDRKLYLRIAPSWPQTARPAESDMQSFGDTGVAGWASATVTLDPDIADLRKSLRQKWRNALNKAEKSGMVAEPCDDEESFTGFLGEYTGFLQDRGFETTVTPELMESLYRHSGPSGAMRCFRGRLGEAPVGSALTIRYGDTVEYLVGTLLEAGRAVSAGQFLVWQALSQAKQDGATRFDVGGMDPDLTPRGIFAFKDGLGGQPYRLANEIEATDGGIRAALVRWRVANARQAAS